MQGWKTENCSSLPETLEMVNANTYIQRRNINRIERDSMDGSEEKETLQIRLNIWQRCRSV